MLRKQRGNSQLSHSSSPLLKIRLDAPQQHLARMLRFLRRKSGPVAAAEKRTDPNAPIKELRRAHLRTVAEYYLRVAINKGSWLFYVVGVIWLLFLPQSQFHQRNYVDENALLPGQTTKYFSALDYHFVKEYRTHIQALAAQSKIAADYASFIEGELRSFGLDASTQDFVRFANHGPVDGSNAYGVFRAPRSDGTEAIVISTPFVAQDGRVNAGGVAYLLALAKFVTKFSHWSKDFVFVVTHPSPVGTQAWLEAYHGKQSQEGAALRYDPLAVHSGVIQEALNLELTGSDEYAAVEIDVTGLNGQLPNADLVSTVVLCNKYEGIPVALHQAVAPEKFESDWNSYLFKADILKEYVKAQAAGLPRGNHALYARYHIEAVTLRGLSDVPGRTYRINGEQLGRSIESMLRSLNNLLERLHHSYWFYLMPTASAYIPLSRYLPPVALLSVTLILESVRMWLAAGEQLTKCPSPPTRIPGTKYAMRSAELSTFERINRPVFLPIVTLAMCHAAGAFALYMAPTIRFVAQHGNINPLNMSAAILVVTACLYGFLVPTLQRIMEGSGASTQKSSAAWTMVKCFACIELGAALIALATLNPSLSILLALPSVPAMYLARPTSNHVYFWGQLVALFVASPVGLLAVMVFADGLHSALETVRLAVDGYTLYGAWLLPFLCLVYWPLNMVAHVIIGMEQ
ncbi:Gaa1-like protein [Fimicolochytrium jonesii]|uniref:Gaa1-like protein n=1 Tax=Fimicolochytrium jonesii TaxID=1396493 RepID=UPI0022FE066C|nr:Gaa1-like protein [Fimicolochytrium jonesii]KAI8824481.1 Gaa1-like protein [Fimicolochytrium jonesii]